MTLLFFRSRHHRQIMATFDRIEALIDQMEADLTRATLTLSSLPPRLEEAVRSAPPSRVNPDRAANLIGEQA